nr:DNA (cytosine-5-)-methyltransferase [Lactococcus insecticola]
MKVLELFAGVGGFRIGLEKANKDKFETKWSNQFEPSRTKQWAYEIYDKHFPDSQNINEDIAKMNDEIFKNMDADMIVGGFPCQDYSVARSLNREKGIEGKKGVLFWEIIRAVKNIQPKYLILENVDRLLKSPSKQRGRDFAIMLKAFSDLDYSVEWRVVNAADYGAPQRRRRVFIFVTKNVCEVSENYLIKNGVMAKAFPLTGNIIKNRIKSDNLPSDIVSVSDTYSSEFYNSGIMSHGKFLTIEVEPKSEGATPLKAIVDEKVEEKYYLSEEKVEKFNYLRGAKKIERKTADGHKYFYSEGGMSPHDDLSLPGRTMLTSEGSINRSTHFIKDGDKYRILTPTEAERLNTFPDNWTEISGITDATRRFLMGNALVTDMIARIAEVIDRG